MLWQPLLASFVDGWRLRDLPRGLGQRLIGKLRAEFRKNQNLEELTREAISPFRLRGHFCCEAESRAAVLAPLEFPGTIFRSERGGGGGRGGRAKVKHNLRHASPDFRQEAGRPGRCSVGLSRPLRLCIVNVAVFPFI